MRHKTLIPKSKKKKKKKNRRGSIFAVIIISAFVYIMVVSLLSRPPARSGIIIDEDVTVTGTIGQGITSSEFGADPSKSIKVTITNLNLASGHGLVITLQGGGSDWRGETLANTTFTIPVPKDSVYTIKLSINSILLSGKIYCHVYIRLV